MADDDYYLMPHKQITELKRQMQELKGKVNRASPKELIDSMNSLTNTIDSLMKLFRQSADELKFEDREGSFGGNSDHKAMNEKLDKIMEQNKIIADSMVAISDMVKKYINKPNLPKPQFQPPIAPKPEFPPPGPQFDQPIHPPPQGLPQEGPIAMPTTPLPDLEDLEPKKKGIFGRFRK